MSQVWRLSFPALEMPGIHYNLAGTRRMAVGKGAKSGQAIREISRLVMAPVLLLEIRMGGLNLTRDGSVATQLVSTLRFAPLAFGPLIETVGHVLRTFELRG